MTDPAEGADLPADQKCPKWRQHSPSGWQRTISGVGIDGLGVHHTHSG